MIESIYVGMSGLMGYSQGLRVIANNTANLNTPGFKGSALQFADLFYSGSELVGTGLGRGQVGYGVNTYTTSINFKQGELRQTGSDLDLAVDGQGLFVLRDDEGEVHYTRAGQFEFDTNGTLVSRTGGSKVMSADGTGNLVEMTLTDRRTNMGRATSTINFAGVLSNTPATPNTPATATLNNVQVLDSIGGEHNLTLNFTLTGNTWAVNVLEGTTAVATGSLVFADGYIVPANSRIEFDYTPTGLSTHRVTLDFSAEVRSLAVGTTSTIAVSRQDGYKSGALTRVTFDDTGTMVLAYSNQQTVRGQQLALARFDSTDAVEASGDNQYLPTDPAAWHFGVADGVNFGKVKSGVIELSNVDLSQQFSDLVIMQRGYQASSQVVSTANEMLQELFSMKGK
jgi:flagellar hook protein FlgE